MGVFVITGGSNGIGFSAAEILRQAGNEVCNLDIVGGDINVNLGNPESRGKAIEELHKRYPEGIDGLICNAGVVVNNRLGPADVIAINYFGAVTMAEGCFDLLQKKHGACCVTCSAALTFYTQGKYDIVELLNNNGDEERILRLVSTFDKEEAGNTMYGVSKYALARWMRRTAPGWARKGVRLNAVAPGSCATKLTENMPREAFEAFVLGLPMPIYYDAKCHEKAEDLGKTIAFLVREGASGICGQLVFCDAGTDGLLKAERFLG